MEPIEHVAKLVDMGVPIPWKDLSAEERKAVDDLLAEKAGKYADWNDVVRMSICLNERKRLSELVEPEAADTQRGEHDG